MGCLRQILSLIVIGVVLCDVYMHNPRGSNNRLNEKTAQRDTNNRLFDSQNNNKGGYNTGDRNDRAAGNYPRRAYSMQYYASGASRTEASKLMVEWTNQHGCGGNPKNKCNVVVQYMCMNNGTDADYPGLHGHRTSTADREEQENLYLRDGTYRSIQSFSNPRYKESDRSYKYRMAYNYKVVDDDRGLHESVWWYDNCKIREANGGLFTADQKLAKDTIGYVTASRTRQNNNGNRNGYECPEERDYYPYWSPTWQTENLNEKYQNTPWLDLAWLGDKTYCKTVYKESFNRKSKFRCVLSPTEDGGRKYGRAINEGACKSEGGTWVEFHSFLEVLTDVTSSTACRKAQSKDKRNRIKWMKLRSDAAEERCVVQAPLPKCGEGPMSRVNHLGNAEYTSADLRGNASRVEVEMPYFPSGQAKRCVLRIRYNITTGDYDPLTTDYKSNNKDEVIENDPEVDVFGNGAEQELALNTAQTGRTFQDRSHVFQVLPRTPEMGNRKLYNLNVRGKRGNIVQTFPAVEYDFVPDKLAVTVDDLVHVQWTGSNTHDNNNDGDDGEGRGGTDRNNLLQMADPAENYPTLIKNARFWDNVQSLTDTSASGEDIAIGLGSSGYYENKDSLKDRRHTLDDKMDNAPASYFGHVLRFKKPGSMFYMCSRNNNFSNRSQKGALWVSKSKKREKREKRSEQFLNDGEKDNGPEKRSEQLLDDGKKDKGPE